MTKTSSQGDFPPAGPGIHGDDGDSSPPCPAQRPEKFQGGPRGPPEALENRPPESTSSGVPFAEPLLANSRNSSTDALRFPIRFNRAIGRPLNSLGPPRIPDPSPARATRRTGTPPSPAARENRDSAIPRRQGEPALRHPPPPGPPLENRDSGPARHRGTGTPARPAVRPNPNEARPAVRPNPHEARPAVRPNRNEARPAAPAAPQGTSASCTPRHTRNGAPSVGDLLAEPLFWADFLVCAWCAPGSPAAPRSGPKKIRGSPAPPKST